MFHEFVRLKWGAEKDMSSALNDKLKELSRINRFKRVVSVSVLPDEVLVLIETNMMLPGPQQPRDY